MQLTVQESGKSTQAVIFPWALASHNNRTIEIQLVKNKIGASQQELVTNSVQHLEYAFANGFNTVSKSKEKKIAVIKGNGELHDILIADFVKSVRENYYIGTFTLDSVAKQPKESLEALTLDG